MKKSKIISTVLFLVFALCLVFPFYPQYNVRFIQSEYNYLFIGVLYFALPCLIILRILYIEDGHLRKLLFAVALMLVVFPCLFVFSVCLQNYYRVHDNLGNDDYQILVDQKIENGSNINTYKVPDVGFAELNGFGTGSSRRVATTRWNNSGKYFPAKLIIRKEVKLNQYLKIVTVVE